MKSFKITVNGNVYDVTVEETTGNPAAAMTAKPTPVAAPTPTPAPASVPAPPPTPTPAAAPVGGNDLESPLPGAVLNILVKVGDKVSKNQTVLILEAMKMENEIVAHESGTVTAIHVTNGQSVETGKALMTIA